MRRAHAPVGELLRERREELGLDLDEVGEALRIKPVYLAAIEQGRTEDLPGPAYAIGFVRAYARLSRARRRRVLDRYKAETAGVRRSPDLTFPVPLGERSFPAAPVLLVGADPGAVRLRHLVLPVDRRARAAGARRRGAGRAAARRRRRLRCAGSRPRRASRERSGRPGTDAGGAAAPAAARRRLRSGDPADASRAAATPAPMPARPAPWPAPAAGLYAGSAAPPRPDADFATAPRRRRTDDGAGAPTRPPAPAVDPRPRRTRAPAVSPTSGRPRRHPISRAPRRCPSGSIDIKARCRLLGPDARRRPGDRLLARAEGGRDLSGAARPG